MVYSDYLKLQIIFLARKGYKVPTISKMLKEEKRSCTQENVYMHLFLKRYMYEETQSIGRKQGSGQLSKVTAETEALRFQRSLWIIDHHKRFDFSCHFG